MLAIIFALAALAQPEIVEVHDGAVTLRGMVFRPAGPGPFPAVLLNHGSGRSKEQLARLGPYEGQAETLGPVFARHGYLLLFLFRQGVGLSASQGRSAIDLLDEAGSRGPEARNALQLQLLEGRELSAARAGLAYLRARRDVDSTRLALVAHSFGGSLTLIQAEREADLRAIVIFSGAGYSWDRSPKLRARLLAVVERIRAPTFFIHAENDFSLNLGKAMTARFEQLGKPCRLKIYPPIGKTAEEGHDFPLRGVSIWEPDVFAFLDRLIKPNR